MGRTSHQALGFAYRTRSRSLGVHGLVVSNAGTANLGEFLNLDRRLLLETLRLNTFNECGPETVDIVSSVCHGKDACELAVHLFSAFQGMAVVAYGSHDPELIVTETRRLKDWIKAL
jgi:hypothetical protein